MTRPVPRPGGHTQRNGSVVAGIRLANVGTPAALMYAGDNSASFYRVERPRALTP